MFLYYCQDVSLQVLASIRGSILVPRRHQLPCFVVIKFFFKKMLRFIVFYSDPAGNGASFYGPVPLVFDFVLDMFFGTFLMDLGSIVGQSWEQVGTILYDFWFQNRNRNMFLMILFHNTLMLV